MFDFVHSNLLLFSYRYWRTIILLTILTGHLNANKTENSKVCSSPECMSAANILQQNIDESYKPCDDFYKFACGGYLKKTIPVNQSKISCFNTVKEKVSEAIKELVEKPIMANDNKIVKAVKNYYNSCMFETNETKEISIEFFKNIIDKLGGWPVVIGDKWDETNFDAFAIDAKTRQFGFRPKSILTLSVFNDIFNSSRKMLYIEPPEGTIDPFQFEFGFGSPVIRMYHEYIIDVAVLFGANVDLATEEVEAVLQFEKQITSTAFNFVTSPLHRANVRQINKLQEIINFIPWLEYINNITQPTVIFTPSDVVNIPSMNYLRLVKNLLQSTPKRIIANYMIWKIIEKSAVYLTDEIRNRALRFQRDIFGKGMQKRIYSKSQKCINLLLSENSGLKVGVSSMYVRKHFENHTKDVIEEMVTYIHDGLDDVLKNITWMDSKSKAAAYRKKNMMKHIIGYPEELINDEILNSYANELSLHPNQYYQNVLKVQRFLFDVDLRNLKNFSNNSTWMDYSDATSANAYYSSTENTIHIPASIIQSPIVNAEWPNYIKYGGLGSIIGHEIMHAFDKTRSMLDERGSANTWLSKASKRQFKVRMRCFLRQYASYTDENLALSVNSAATLNENLSDNFGSLIAYRAYENWVKNHGEDELLPGLQYNAKQLFWISLMNILCIKTTIEALKDQYIYNEHAPHHFRAFGIVTNSHEFAKAFDCPVHSPMNPSKKCEIW